MANRARSRRRYRIVLSDQRTVTEVSAETFRDHLQARRIEASEKDPRRAATTEDWFSFIDHATGQVVFSARETKVGIAIPSNFRMILERLLFCPPFNEWRSQQVDQMEQVAA